VRLVPAKTPPVAAVAWNAVVAAQRGKRPSAVVATSGAARITGRLSPAGKRRFRARLTFPFAGAWRLTARLGSRTYPLARVQVGEPPPVVVAIPGATAVRICGGTGEPHPQYALAREGDRLWVACRRQHTLQRIDAGSGSVTGQLGLGTLEPYSIAATEGAVWSVDRGSTLTRVDTGSGRRDTDGLQSNSAYLWSAAGSVWVAEDGARTLARIDPQSRQVTARIATGDGASALGSSGGSAWIVNHREATLDRIELATNAVHRLGTLPGDAPERMVLAAGSLWVTGRGTDLLRVDPETGAVQARIEVGAGAIDLAAAGGRVVVFAPTDADDQRGLPVVERVLAVDPATNGIVDTVRTTGRVVLDGLVSDGSSIWLADTAVGRLYRLGVT
jgi:hypothetical protein